MVLIQSANYIILKMRYRNVDRINFMNTITFSSYSLSRAGKPLLSRLNSEARTCGTGDGLLSWTFSFVDGWA